LNTVVDLSKILEGKTQIFGENVIKTAKCMGVSQLLGGVPRLTPKVYAYGLERYQVV